MLSLGLSLWQPRIGTVSLSGAATLLGSETDGVAIDFTDMSIVVRDTVTPANNFAGNVNSWLTYTSPSTKWILGSNGLYSSGTTLRTEYNASGAGLGCRIEPGATNLFLNSRAPATQTVTVAGATYTISGVGAPGATITLTGTGTGTLTGTGAVDRDKLTVVCMAGALLLTVAGTWDFVQVETGAIATSPIVTAGATVTRAVDTLTKVVSAYPHVGAFSMIGKARSYSMSVACIAAVRAATASVGSTAFLRVNSATAVSAGGSATAFAANFPATVSAGDRFGVASRYDTAGNAAVQGNGGTRGTSATQDYTNTGTTTLHVGALVGASQLLNGHLESLIILPRLLADAEMTSGSTP